MRKFKIIFITFTVFIICTLIVIIMQHNRISIITENSKVLYADYTVALNTILGNDSGFTCTGVVYDHNTNSFYVGDAGKEQPEDDSFRAVIRQISFNLDNQERVIDCYSQFPNMQDIQGVTLDMEHNIWFCSHGENLVRGIDENGTEIGMFNVRNPSGIAYYALEDAFWVLSDRSLMLYSAEGMQIEKYGFRVAGQDQLYMDNSSNILYITAGSDYYGDSYIYTFDIENEIFELKYILKDSYAIEGISIIDNALYIFNDGYYHDAKIPINQVNIYKLD